MKIILTLLFCCMIGAVFSQEKYTVTYNVRLNPKPPQRPILKQGDDTDVVSEAIRKWDAIHPVMKFDRDNANDRDAVWYRDSLMTWLMRNEIHGLEPKTNKTLNAKDIQKCFYRTDTVWAEDTMKIVKRDINTYGLKFSEEWSLDNTGAFKKSIRSCTLLATEYDESGNIKRYYDNVLLKPSTAAALVHRCPITYVIERKDLPFDADSSLVFENGGDTALLTARIKSGLESGAIKGYANMDTLIPLSLADVKKILMPPPDTLSIIDPVSFQEKRTLIDRIVKIDGIRFYEDWSLDKAGNITKHVLAYTLITRRSDVYGYLIGFFDFITIKPETTQ